jgi:hypothetical protein
MVKHHSDFTQHESVLWHLQKFHHLGSCIRNFILISHALPYPPTAGHARTKHVFAGDAAIKPAYSFTAVTVFFQPSYPKVEKLSQ